MINNVNCNVQAINQPAVICYTSGTTANPKGVLLSQVVLMMPMMRKMILS